MWAVNSKVFYRDFMGFRGHSRVYFQGHQIRYISVYGILFLFIKRHYIYSLDNQDQVMYMPGKGPTLSSVDFRRSIG